MRRSRFSSQQIAKILKECASGRRIADVCREHNISSSTIYHWRTAYAAKDFSFVAHAPDLELENRQLRQRLIDLSLAHEELKGELRRLRSRRQDLDD